jgi:hypothetical protein
MFMHAHEALSDAAQLDEVEAGCWLDCLLDEETSIDDYRAAMLRRGCSAVVAQGAVEQMIHQLNETRIINDSRPTSVREGAAPSHWGDGRCSDPSSGRCQDC